MNGLQKLSEQDFIRKDGEMWMSSDMLGTKLGFANPRDGIYRIFHRNIDDLSPFTGVDNLSTPGGVQQVRLFNEQGCYIVAMLANTEQARIFRRQLAEFLKNMRQHRQQLELDFERHTELKKEIAELELKKFLHHSRLLSEAKLKRMMDLYRTGLLSHDEIGLLFGISGSHAAHVRSLVLASRGMFPGQQPAQLRLAYERKRMQQISGGQYVRSEQ